jgi:hypothetical protein
MRRLNLVCPSVAIIMKRRIRHLVAVGLAVSLAALLDARLSNKEVLTS